MCVDQIDEMLTCTHVHVIDRIYCSLASLEAPPYEQDRARVPIIVSPDRRHGMEQCGATSLELEHGGRRADPVARRGG
jgi:hypothetical protein